MDNPASQITNPQPIHLSHPEDVFKRAEPPLLVYNYRSAYVASSTAPAPTLNSQGTVVIDGQTLPSAATWAAPVTNVALSANWNLSKRWQLSFSGTNLTNPTRAQYLYSQAEQQKLDISGRQYYLELRHKF